MLIGYPGWRLPAVCLLAVWACIWPLRTPAAPAAAVVEFYYDGDCVDCLMVRREVLPDLTAAFPEILLQEYDLREEAALLELFERQRLLEVRDAHPVAAIVNGRVYLGGVAAIRDGLFAAVAAADMQDLPEPPLAFQGDAVAQFARGMTLFTLLLAGLADGLNPCAFTTIILLAGMLLAYAPRRRGLWLVGAAFCAGVFAAYLLLGFGILRLLVRWDVWQMLGWGFRAAAGALLLALAVLTLRDAWCFWRGGRPDDLWLRLPERWRRSARRLAHAVAVSPRRCRLAFCAGALVTLLEAPCTGQLYAPVLFYLSRRGDGRTWGLLLAYNLMFVLPHVMVFALAAGSSVNGLRLADWSRRHLVPARLLQAFILVVLGCLLLYG